MTTIIFDIETGPLTREEVLAVSSPFPEFKPPEPFDPSSVKTGNMKDEEKIKAKIETEREKHGKASSLAAQKYRDDKAAHEAKLMDKAGLSAVTGQVLAIGYMDPDRDEAVCMKIQESNESNGGERKLLSRFWDRAAREMANGGRMVGFNIFQFDLPFLVRRSWKHQVEMPQGLRDGYRWNPAFVDLYDTWRLGTRGNELTPCSLDAVSKFFGLDGKGDVAGADFARLFREDRERAVDYLKGDLSLTCEVGFQMCVI